MAVLYSASETTVFTRFNEEFDFSLVSGQYSDPNKVNATNYYMYRWQLRVSINDANNAISEGNNMALSQAACDRGTFLRENSSLFF